MIRPIIAPGTISKNNAISIPKHSPTRLVWLAGWPGPGRWGCIRAPDTVAVRLIVRGSKVADMAYDVARVRGLHPSLGDGWVHFDAPSGMLIPDSVATTVSTAFRGSFPSTAGPHPSAQRSAAVLEAARQAVGDLVNADPRGVVLGADRAILLNALADASSSRAGLGYEIVVTRLDDEANIAPWLRAANRFGAKVKWAEVDIETGDLPSWQWEEPDRQATRLVAVDVGVGRLSARSPTCGAVTKLVHDVGGLVVVDHSAAAPYRLIDIHDIDADVVAVNAVGWGGPPIGALVFRDPSTDRHLRLGVDQPVRHRTGAPRARRAPVRPARPASSPASNTWLRSTSRHAARGANGWLSQCNPRRPTWTGIFDYLMASLRSLPLVMVIGRPEARIPVVSFAVQRSAGRTRGAAAGGQRDPGDLQRQLARARRDRRQRHRRRGHRRAGALFDDGRGRPVGARAGVAGLSPRPACG